MWCIYGERHRTNNSVEGWHHKINNEINKNEGNLLRLLHILYDDSLLSSLRSHRQQNFPSTYKIQYIDADDFIINAQMQLTSGDISVGHFLEKIR